MEKNGNKTILNHILQPQQDGFVVEVGTEPVQIFHENMWHIIEPSITKNRGTFLSQKSSNFILTFNQNAFLLQ